MSFPGTISKSVGNPSSLIPSSSNNMQYDESQKGNAQTTNNDDNDNDNEDNDEIEGIIEEEQEEEDNKNKEESQAPTKPVVEGQGKLERLFIYLRTGFSYRPIPKINSTVMCLEITGGIFIAVGIIIIIFSNKIKQIEIRYDNLPNCKIGTKCDVNFTMKHDMKKDVFVFYRLKNFYQNHRRYMKSKSIKQLKGNIMKEGDIKDDCEPITLNKDIYEGLTSLNGSKILDPNGVAHPCGLIAKSFFNDTYEIRRRGGNEEIIINDTNIAWSKDKEKFKNSENYTEHQWIDVENERFIVWMRPAALPNFRKTWGRIEKDLKKGEYTLTITNNYPVKSFHGKKYFILTTVNALGGKNYFLGILYLAIGGVSIVSGIIFWIGYKQYNSEKFQKID